MSHVILNYTPHDVHLHTPDGAIRTIPSTCGPAGAPRVLETMRRTGPAIDGMPVYDVTYGEVSGLPDERDGTYVIVSSMVLDHPSLRHRRDLLAPLDEVRNAGRVIGCRAFRMHVPRMRG